MTALLDTRQGYQGLLDIYGPVAVGVFVLFTVLIIGFALRYRARDDEPSDLHEHAKLEGGYVTLLAAVAVVLLYLTFHWMGTTLSNLPGQPTAVGRAQAAASGGPRPVERIRVTASRWNWRFDYPRWGISQFGTGTTIPTLVVPQGDVLLRMSSIDVIHAFFIPYLRFKRDAFPDRPTDFTLRFSQLGFHHAWGECAEFCGLRHSYMQFNVQVLTRAAFRRWAAARRAGRPQQQTPILNKQGRYS